MTPNTLSRETLSDQIAKQLLDYIVSEKLEPGSLLPSEIKLADDFGVSRSVVREALRSMAAQGTIEVLTGKGLLCGRWMTNYCAFSFSGPLILGMALPWS
jgi:DNA-binding FadR family transcriptional regulator